MSLSHIQSIIIPYLKRYGVRRAELFGSQVRGDANEKSDVDLLVELPKGASLFDFIGLKQDLEDALGVRVDLVEYAAVKPSLEPYIFAHTKPMLTA